MKLIFNILFLLLPATVSAQYFRINVSGIVNANFAKYNFIEQEGLFSTDKNHINLGIGADISCFLSKETKVFFKTGVRAFASKSGVSANHSVPGIAAPAISWQFRYFHVAVPFYIGKTIIPFSKSDFHFDVWAGCSIGYVRTETFYTYVRVQKTYDDTEFVGAGVGGPRSLDNFDRKFMPSLDIGISFPPIPALPRLNIGVLVSHNLKSTPYVQKDGFIANADQGITQIHYFRMQNSFTHLLFSLNYSFGKKWVKGLERKGGYNSPILKK